MELDERGRITIPSALRQSLRGSKLRIERAEDGVIVIRPEFGAQDLLGRIRALSLSGDKRRARCDAALVKERYGGFKD